DEPGPRAARDDGHPGLAADAHDGLDLRGGRGQHHDVGYALVEREHVALVGEAALGGEHDTPRSEQALEPGDYAGGKRHGVTRISRSSRCRPRSTAWRCSPARGRRWPAAPARA